MSAKKDITINQNIVNVNRFTNKSCTIRMYNGDSFAYGTAFIYRYGRELFLVTAWHNLTGRNFISKRALSSTCWIPDKIKIRFALEVQADQGFQNGSLTFSSHLYCDLDCTLPIWMVDAEQHSRIDVAVIPLQIFIERNLVSEPNDKDQLKDLLTGAAQDDDFFSVSFVDKRVRLPAHTKHDLINTLEVSQDLFIIGFPEVVARVDGFPIWKRGTIASEPQRPLKDRPCFLIDSATRPGLSGSPVVARYNNPAYELRGGVLSRSGTELAFCGLYTARIDDSADKAQLGVVWPLAVIEKIISDGVSGKSAHDFAGLCDEGADDPLV